MESEIKLGLSDAMDLLGGLWNVGYALEFKDYFEKKLEDEIASFIKVNKGFVFVSLSRAYSQCPNFAAWLRFYVEFICHKALASLVRAEHCKKKISAHWAFEEIVKAIDKIAEREAARTGVGNNEFEKMKKALKTVIELRHTIQHGGLPNVLRNARLPGIDIKDAAKMIIPQDYIKTKEIFDDANKLLALLPAPIVRMYADGHAALIESSKVVKHKSPKP